ncbi:MAG: histidinol dehydrogenase [Fibrobacterota bacterium]
MITIPLIDYAAPDGARILQDIKAQRKNRDTAVDEAVRAIYESIATEGDRALIDCCRKFDKQDLTPQTLRLSQEALSTAAKKVDPDLKQTIIAAAHRIRAYHTKQTMDRSFTMETDEGVLSQKVVPLKRAGLYIPGGFTAYPSTVLMNAIPAQLAGVEEIVAITPCREGNISPEIACVLEYLNITEVYQIGGAHGIAALAEGTETIPAVDKIVGPGNAYVAAAKKYAYGSVDIDSIAGPSEIAILADDSADPYWMALDLLSQAEHGSGDETAFLVTESQTFAQKVRDALYRAIDESPVRKIFENLAPNALVLIHTDSRETSHRVINTMGPEHLEIVTRDPRADLEHIHTAAAIFLGPWTPVPLGDYFVGTNHVLPTGGAARYASPLGVDDFLKRISIAEIHEEGLQNCAHHVSRFARAEKFIHHAMTVEKRTGYTPEQQ